MKAICMPYTSARNKQCYPVGQIHETSRVSINLATAWLLPAGHLPCCKYVCPLSVQPSLPRRELRLQCLLHIFRAHTRCAGTGNSQTRLGTATCTMTPQICQKVVWYFGTNPSCAAKLALTCTYGTHGLRDGLVVPPSHPSAGASRAPFGYHSAHQQYCVLRYVIRRSLTGTVAQPQILELLKKGALTSEKSAMPSLCMEATMAFAVPDVSALRDWCDSTTLSLYPEKAPGKSFPMVSIMAWKATTWSLPSRPLRHQRHAKQLLIQHVLTLDMRWGRRHTQPHQWG